MSDTIVRALGSVFHNNRIYGARHNVTVMAMEHAYEELTAFLETHEQIQLTLSADGILVNEVPCESRSGLAQTVINVLRGWDVRDLTLEHGLTPDEFVRILQLLAQSPEKTLATGDFAQLLGSAAINHIRSRNVTLVEVADEEIVVDRDSQDAVSATDRALRDTRLMAFMEGAGDTGDGAIAADMRSVASAPAALGNLIINSAHQAVAGALPSPETRLGPEDSHALVTKIVECLRRAFDALKNDPAAQTQKGKKDLSRTLAELERELREALETLVTNMADLDMVPVSVAIEEMTEELMVDALATEYLKKRRMIESSEKRLTRYVSRKGGTEELEDLKARLMEGGLDEGGWSALLAQSSQPAEPGEIPGRTASPKKARTVRPSRMDAHRLTATTAELRILLDELVGAFDTAIGATDGARREKLRGLVNLVEEQIRAAVGEAERRLDRLGHVVTGGADDGTATPEVTHARRLSRRELLEILSELVQELLQPLSVISCAFQVVAATATNIGESEQDLLRLGHKSAERMAALISALGRIAGMPSSLTPRAVDI